MLSSEGQDGDSGEKRKRDELKVPAVDWQALTRYVNKWEMISTPAHGP